MFSSIKLFISIFIGAVAISFLAYLKYLKSSIKSQEENIFRLKKEIEVINIVSKDEIKKAVFETLQKARVKAIKKSEVTLDKIELEIKRNENNDNDDNDDDNDKFFTSRV